MEGETSGLFTLTGPVLYAASAVVVTIAVGVFGYLYTHRQLKDGSQTTKSTRRQTETKQTGDAQSKKTTNAKDKQSSVTPGTWPVDDDMVARGCPVPPGTAVPAAAQPSQSQERIPRPTRYPSMFGTAGENSEPLTIPEDMPENMKKILEMGFPGCPMFRRAVAPDSTQGKDRFPSVFGTTDSPSKPEVHPMPADVPEHLQKVLEMGFPGCPVFKRTETRESSSEPRLLPPAAAAPAPSGGHRRPGPASDKKVVSEVYDMFEKQYGADMAQSSSSWSTKGFGELLDKAKARLEKEAAEKAAAAAAVPAEQHTASCPRREHCQAHCTCYKRPKSDDSTSDKPLKDPNIPEDSDEDEDEEMEDLSKKVFPMPEDAPENIKRILEMGFPGCPLFRRLPPKTDTDAAAAAAPPAKAKAAPAKAKAPAAKAKAATAKSRPTSVPSPKGSGTAGKSGPKTEGDQGDGSDKKRDPVEFCNHLQSEVKRTKQKVAISKIEEEMTEQQKEQERSVQQKQLEAIFSLMQSQEDKFGVDSFDDVKKQMNLYM